MKRATRKNKRGARETKLSKKLPPEPSAAAARWDATRSAGDYIQQASSAISQTEARLSIFRELALPEQWHRAEIGRMKYAETLLREAKSQLLECRPKVLRLLDKKNWVSELPRISVEARVNQRGNFVANWTTPHPPLFYPPDNRLENNTGFRDDFFLRHCWHLTDLYSDVNPAAVLLRFRNVPLNWDEGNHPAVRYIMYAIRAEFEAVINEITKSLEVVASPRIGFARDDKTGLELILT